jgi:hypothetical protein
MSGLCSPARFAKRENLIRAFPHEASNDQDFCSWLARLGKIDNEKSVPLLKQRAEERLFLTSFLRQLVFSPSSFSRGKSGIFDLTHAPEAASCRPCCLNQRQLLKATCKEASLTLSGRSAI